MSQAGQLQNGQLDYNAYLQQASRLSNPPGLQSSRDAPSPAVTPSSHAPHMTSSSHAPHMTSRHHDYQGYNTNSSAAGDGLGAGSGAGDMRGLAMSPPPAHQHGLPGRLSPAGVGSAPHPGAGNSPVNSPGSDRRPPDSPLMSPGVTSPSANMTSSVATSGEQHSPSGGDAPHSPQPQIYPWMRRIHVGNGEKIIIIRLIPDCN